MFQLLRLKFSITAHCFQVNSLAVRLANVLKNSGGFSCWNGDWKSGRDSILSSVTILSNSPHSQPATTKRCQNHLPAHDPKVLQNAWVERGTSALPFTWGVVPGGWENRRQPKFCICSSSAECVINNWLHPTGILAVFLYSPRGRDLCSGSKHPKSEQSFCRTPVSGKERF